MGRLIIPANGGDYLFPRSPFNENMGRSIIPAHGGDFLFPRSPFNKNGCELIIPANGGDFLPLATFLTQLNAAHLATPLAQIESLRSIKVSYAFKAVFHIKILHVSVFL